MNLNIRNVDWSLMRHLKVEAAGKGITLRAHVLALLGCGEPAGVSEQKACPNVPVHRSTKVNVRLPDALHATIMETVKSKGVTLTAVIVGTLNTALGLQLAPASPAAIMGKPSHPQVPKVPKVPRAADVVAATGGKVTVAVRPKRGAAADRTCPYCGGPTVVFGTSRRCKTCGRNLAA
jgi:hypothetical protein